MSTDQDLPLVVLTGASGFLGSQTLDYLLKQNYRVLAPVRSLSRLSYQKARYANTHYAARIQYVEVPDQSVPSSFGNILTGAEAIIHNATVDPLAPAVAGEVPEKLITPVVDMASAIFLAALEVPSIKRFVYVGSSVSVVNGEILDGKKFTEEDWSEVSVEDAVRAGGGWLAYSVAKTLAEKKIWELTEERKPGFEVVVLNPPEIIGKSLHEVKEAKSISGLGAVGLKNLIDGKEATGISPASYGNFMAVGEALNLRELIYFPSDYNAALLWACTFTVYPYKSWSHMTEQYSNA
ncbi:NAD(P)-binding protein [Tuber magnatum]|uniref:NAD(P)-binding protein n=1 Tax=Tuber magnatum TaxID=42249 RepID=A0A317SRR0_9PEZI|nr:NAD(P)-binding protein [Tuber magnatum]